MNFFYETYMLAKQAKYILKNFAIKALFFEEKIYINLVRLIIPIKYNDFKYGLFLKNTLHITIKWLFKIKN